MTRISVHFRLPVDEAHPRGTASLLASLAAGGEVPFASVSPSPLPPLDAFAFSVPTHLAPLVISLRKMLLAVSLCPKLHPTFRIVFPAHVRIDFQVLCESAW